MSQSQHRSTQSQHIVDHTDQKMASKAAAKDTLKNKIKEFYDTHVNREDSETEDHEKELNMKNKVKHFLNEIISSLSSLGNLFTKSKPNTKTDQKQQTDQLSNTQQTNRQQTKQQQNQQTNQQQQRKKLASTQGQTKQQQNQQTNQLKTAM